MFLKAVDDGGIHVVERLHVFGRDGSERGLLVAVQLLDDAGHELIARRQTKNPRPPPVRLAAFPADEPRPLKLIEKTRDGLLGHETFLGQRRWFRSLGTPEHRIKDQELRV